ncbi:hypothetical protein BCR32DRAFT_329427 [Anaeromyces robustus]|uniref:Uncharacterized protein n=1 Tax=Anaeromyces robustus TaxID=1754192 RepID=A0A1Y1WSB7_9FUNG|nr:hypothetical protein BCR32DRAFT_329427 [Anaeromyces robustus]|eukprot:ORX76295.1 hypothetical protein BCR32DRAFT_329427 [Anaeromyces robustus]
MKTLGFFVFLLSIINSVIGLVIRNEHDLYQQVSKANLDTDFEQKAKEIDEHYENSVKTMNDNF